MSARVKKSGKYQYLQIVENRKEAGKVRQRVITTLGRLDHLQEKGRVETLIRSLCRFPGTTMLIFSGKSDISADASSIGSVFFELMCNMRLCLDSNANLDPEHIGGFNVEDRGTTNGPGPMFIS